MEGRGRGREGGEGEGGGEVGGRVRLWRLVVRGATMGLIELGMSRGQLLLFILDLTTSTELFIITPFSRCTRE